MKQRTSQVAKSMKPPRLPKKFSVRELVDGQLLEHGHYSALALTNISLNGQVAGHLTLREVHLMHVDLGSTDFEAAELTDARCEACDFATASWYQASFYRVEFVDCRMTGFLAGETQFHDTLFKQCKLNLAQFRFAKFHMVRFEQCDLSDSDFLEADLSGVEFVRCNLPQVEFSGTRLAGVDLRGSNTEGARVGPRELQGAIIDPQQAIALVRSLGIRVEYPDPAANQ